jgi:hypothetical protein
MTEKPTPDFTLNQLREILGVPEIVDDPDALTVPEMAEELGVDRSQLYPRIREALEAGKLIEVTVLRPNSLGHIFRRKGYKPAPQPT